MKENYIKISKLAKDLGVTKQTIWNWKYNGDLEFVKVGNLNCVTKETYNNLLGIENKKKESVVIY